MTVKNSIERNIYIKTLHENIGRILMDKLFDKYSGYINHKSLNTLLHSNGCQIYIYDHSGAFFDALCNKILHTKSADKNTVIYQIMSPYHKKDVIYGLLVIDNNIVFKDILNTGLCKPLSLYTVDFSLNDVKYLNFSYNIFKISNKIQQE